MYRARDPRLGRDVALKVLPAAFALDVERVARFRREAQVLAALNHPHIASIHGLEEADGLLALVLELVEGPTLADRLANGRLPPDEALPIARQIVDALEAAHEQGIIHRDLKPANIKITPDGVVKVLDFGLAKPLGPPEAGHDVRDRGVRLQPDLTASPTVTSPAMMTGVGMILGTAAYMSPEQAKGHVADKRSDVWAFGCVLYEMLTGRRAFEGDDVSDTMAAVLRAEPDWNALPPAMPRGVHRLLRACLQKDRKQRIPDIAIARFEIDDALRGPQSDIGIAASRSGTRWTVAAAATIAVAAASALTALGAWWYLRPAPPAVIRFEIAPSLAAPFTVGPNGTNLIVSPDGSRVIYHVRRREGALDIRRLDQLDPQPIPGTERAIHPSFSSDGQTLAFLRDAKLVKLALDANVVTPLCDVTNVQGSSWIGGEAVVFAQAGTQGGLFRVSASGGKPERIAAADAGKSEQAYLWPDVLPDGRAVLFTIRRDAAGGQPQIAVRSLASGEQKVLTSGTYAKYIPTGHLLYVQGTTLMAAPFDVGRLEITGSAVTIQEGIVTKGNGSANYDVADDGTLVYAPGTGITYGSRFVWKDRSGKLLGVAAGDQLDYPRYLRLSPDGRRLVATIGPAQEGSIWIFDLASGGQPSKLTFKAHNIAPTWTSDGRRVVFASTQDASIPNLYSLPSDGSQITPQRLTTSPEPQSAGAWSSDGRWLIFAQGSAENRSDLWVIDAAGDNKPQPWLQTMFAEEDPRFSPDGRSVAFVSDQTGNPEVWVRPFPGPGSPLRVSANGGHDPMWARNGKELFFQESNKLMSAPAVAMQPQLRFDTPRALFEDGFIPWEPNTPRTYDVAPDGRFLMIEQPPGYFTQRFAVVLGWFEELKRRAPAN